MTPFLLAAAGPDSTPSRVVLLLHVASAIIGIGGIALNTRYQRDALARQGEARLAVLQANFRVTLAAEKAIYLVLLTGVALVLLSDGAYGFGQTWVWSSLVVFVAMLGVSHGVLIPSSRSMVRLVRGDSEGKQPADEAALAALARRAGMAAPALHLLLVVLLVLMIWKPGA